MVSLDNALVKDLLLLPKQSKIMIIGEPDTGKSTITAMLARWFQNQSQNIAVVDSDIGQSDIGPPGFVSYGIMKQDTKTLQSIRDSGSYMVGKTSPYGRGLSLVTGTRVCVQAARRRETGATLIDTCGLVSPPKGVQLKCAKAQAVKPDLILALHTPGLIPLVNSLKSLGFNVRNFLPSKHVQAKSADERMKNRVSCWNRYIGDNPSLLNVYHSNVMIRRWWDEGRYVDIDQIPDGTVVGLHDSETSGFQIPGIWTVLEGDPFILTPLAEDYKLDTVWVTAYKLGLKKNTVVSA